MSRIELPSKALSFVGPIPNPGFDFTSDLAVGETIISGTVTPTVWWGNDPNPSAILLSTAAAVSPFLIQRFQNGVLGTIYLISVAALSSSGFTYTKAGYLAVVPDA